MLKDLFSILFRSPGKKGNRKKQEIPLRKYKKGLVLSGGGARGIAHLGAVKALYEYGHQFDVIIGTSMGAMVGSVLANGYHPDEVMEKLKSSGNLFLTFFRPDLSTNNMLTMSGARNILEKLLTVQNIEELPIHFIATATDFTHGKPHYFEKGNIIDAVIASSSIPIIFPPVMMGGIQYIDGGVLNNLPVRYIRDECEKIAGFHVNPQNLGLQNGEVKGFINIADRAFNLCMLNNVIPDIPLCDFYLEHENLDEYSTFDFSKAKEIFYIGYENTKKALIENNQKLIISTKSRIK
jgi:NTE family protein